jgi:hypothetical protein
MSPLFIGALAILLINDFFLKFHFHNFITGKLSDVTGLFIFPLFWIAFFPKFRKLICYLTALLFVFWKSEFSQVFIDGWNAFSMFNISRVVDYTDLFALPVLFFSYQHSLKEIQFYLPRIIVAPVAVLAFFAFCATSYNNNFTYNRTYQLHLSKQEVVSRLNSLRKDTMQLPISLDVQRADTSVVSDSDTLYFSIASYEHHTDTLFKYDYKAQKTTDEIDTVMHLKNPKYDTTFISNSGFFTMKFDVTNEDDAKLYPGMKTFAEGKFRLNGDNAKCELKLISVYIGGSAKYQREKDGQDILLKRFEKEIIDKLK